jgi:hypothetical protein
MMMILATQQEKFQASEQALFTTASCHFRNFSPAHRHVYD